MILYLGLLGALLIFSPITFAQTSTGNCADQARTELERAYCKIKAANSGGTLPSLEELRRNPEKTQRLLLRRPAEQAGIKLPPEAAHKPSPKPVPKASVAGAAREPADIPPTPEAAGSGSLSHCQLSGASIRCGKEQFRLQGNLPNNRLLHGVLDPDRPIDFAEFSGNAADPTQVMPYLSTTYQRYLEAMLDIGLGAATMSFTKFHHTFMEAQGKGTQFGKRLSTMFEFLKKDKASMGVQAHYNDEMPESLAQCMGLGEQLLVCDNVQQNWVYKKAGL